MQKNRNNSKLKAICLLFSAIQSQPEIVSEVYYNEEAKNFNYLVRMHAFHQKQRSKGYFYYYEIRYYSWGHLLGYTNHRKICQALENSNLHYCTYVKERNRQEAMNYLHVSQPQDIRLEYESKQLIKAILAPDTQLVTTLNLS